MKEFILTRKPKFWGGVYLILALIIFPICYHFLADNFHYSTLTKEVIFAQKIQDFKKMLSQDMVQWLKIDEYPAQKKKKLILKNFRRPPKNPPFKISDIRLSDEYFTFILEYAYVFPPELNMVKDAPSNLYTSHHYSEECQIKLYIPDITDFAKKGSKSPVIPIELKAPPSAPEEWRLAALFPDISEKKLTMKIYTSSGENLTSLCAESEIKFIQSKFFNPTKELQVSRKTLLCMEELYNLHSNKPINLWMTIYSSLTS